MAIVVADLGRLGEAKRRIAAAAGGGRLFRDGIVLHIPVRPVERRLVRDDGIGMARAGRRGAKQVAVIHFRRIDDLAGIGKGPQGPVPA